MSAAKQIMIVEDEMIVALDMEGTLTDLGYQVSLATTVDQALKLAASGVIDVAIVDCHLPDGTADELATSLRRAGIPFVVCSGEALEQLGDVFQGTPYLAKPFTTDGLVAAISSLWGAADIAEQTSQEFMPEMAPASLYQAECGPKE